MDDFAIDDDARRRSDAVAGDGRELVTCSMLTGTPSLLASDCTIAAAAPTEVQLLQLGPRTLTFFMILLRMAT